MPSELYRIFSACSAAAFTVTVLAGCSSDVTTSIKSQDEREYVVSVLCKGNPVLSVECEYLGKAPVDEDDFRSTFKHNWSQHDTDFYKLTLTNKSRHAVNVRSVDYRMDVGDYRGNSRFESKSIAATWGSSEIAPGESISRDTHFVWAVRSDNILYKLYRFETRDDDGQTVNFEVDLPLRYRK